MRADLESSLRWWGLGVLLLGLLALGQFPGGFTLPIWSILGLGLGAVGVGVIALRWRVEGWMLRSPATRAEEWQGESETWQFALIGWISGLGGTYVLGLLLHIMQPVHLGISLLESAIGYALGFVIWTPSNEGSPRACRGTDESGSADVGCSACAPIQGALPSTSQLAR